MLKVDQLVTLLSAIIDLPAFNDEPSLSSRSNHDVVKVAVANVLEAIEQEMPHPYLELCIPEKETVGIGKAEAERITERLSVSIHRHVSLPYLKPSCEESLVQFVVCMVVGSMRQGESLDTMLQFEQAATHIFEIFVQGSAAAFMQHPEVPFSN